MYVLRGQIVPKSRRALFVRYCLKPSYTVKALCQRKLRGAFAVIPISKQASPVLRCHKKAAALSDRQNKMKQGARKRLALKTKVCRLHRLTMKITALYCEIRQNYLSGSTNSYPCALILSITSGSISAFVADTL